MICWSCEKNVEPGVVCPQCKAVLPPQGATDHFAVLHVPRRFTIDHDTIEARYRELARRVHPDRFARSDPRERRAAMQRTVQINEAWRILRDPFRRAEYLLSLGGASAENETEMPPEFLVEMLEKREALGEAQIEGDRDTVVALVEEMRQRSKEAMAGVAAKLDGNGQEPGQEPGNDVALTTEQAKQAAREFATVRYYRRFLEQAEAVADHMASDLGRQTGAAHAG